MFTRTLALIALGLTGLVAIPAQARDGHDFNHGPSISFTFSNYQNVWVPGYWVRHGHRHVWVDGYWARQPVRQRYEYNNGHDRHGHHDKHRNRHYSRKCG